MRTLSLSWFNAMVTERAPACRKELVIALGSRDMGVKIAGTAHRVRAGANSMETDTTVAYCST